MHEMASQDVEKETTAQSEIHLPSTFRSPATRFGPPRAKSVPPPAQASRPCSPDFLTQLGTALVIVAAAAAAASAAIVDADVGVDAAAAVAAAATAVSCLMSTGVLQLPAAYMCRCVQGQLGTAQGLPAPALIHVRLCPQVWLVGRLLIRQLLVG